MTNGEIGAILQASQRILYLASLENARFDVDPQNDKEIKRAIRPYILWFNDEISRYCR